MVKSYTDGEILEAFRIGGLMRERAWEFIYKDWRSMIIGAIIAKGGEVDEALEAFQEVAISFEKRVKQADFELQNKLSTYLIRCVYNRWIKMKLLAKRSIHVEIEDGDIKDFIESVEKDLVKDELRSVLSNSLSVIGERCKTILAYFINGYSMREIADQMKFKGGEQVAKNEKHKCLTAYLNHLDANPQIREYIRKMKDV